MPYDELDQKLIAAGYGATDDNTPTDYTVKDSDGVVLLDPDTVQTNDGKRIRLPGIDALEVDHLTHYGIAPGEAGGTELHNDVLNLVNEGGYTQATSTGELDDTGKREIGDLVNPETGETLSTGLIRAGLVTPTIHSTDDQYNAYLEGAIDRFVRKQNGEENEWDKISNRLEANLQEAGVRAKQLASSYDEYNPALHTGVEIETPDRYLDNTATRSVATAWELGKLGTQEGAYSFLDIIGDVTGIDTISAYGEGHAERIRKEVQALPGLRNQAAFDADGNWTLDGISDFTDYVATTAATSAPYLLMSFLSAAAAPVTAGATLAIPAAVYAGQTYAAQDDDAKSAGVALLSGAAQGALDIAGIKGAGSALNFFSKDGRRKLVNQLATQKGISNEAAERLLAQSLAGQLKGMTKLAKKQLAQQMHTGYLLRGIARGAGVGAAREGLTEVAQETVGLVGENYNDLSRVKQNELKATLMNAAIGGFVLGGGFSSVSATTDAITVRDAVKGAQTTNDLGNRDTAYQGKRKGQGLHVNQEQRLDELNEEAKDLDQLSLRELSKDEQKRRDDLGVVGKTIDYFKQGGPLALVQGWAPNLMNPYFNRGDTMVLIGSLIGANRAYAGVGDDVYQQLKQGGYEAMIPDEGEAVGLFNARNTKEVSDIMYSKSVSDYLDGLIKYAQGAKVKDFQEAASRYGVEFNHEHKDAILKMAQQFASLDEAKGKDPGSFLKERVINKSYLEKNINKFIEKLIAKGVKATEAKQIAEDIRDLDFVEDVSDTQLGLDPLQLGETTSEGAIVKSSLANDPDFAEFYDQDLYYNTAADNARTAAVQANDQFFGKNGEKMGRLLQLAHQKGEISVDEMQFLAAELGDYMDAKSGQYKRIENNALRTFQQHGVFLATINQLPLATVSSLVELGLTSRMLTTEQIHKQIAPLAQSTAAEMKDWMNEYSSKATGGRIQREGYAAGERARLQEAGYLVEQQSARQRAGIADSNARLNNLTNGFFKAIGLQGYTNMTRMARLAISNDAIRDWALTVQQSKGEQQTIDGLDAREQLVNLGLDPDQMADLMSREDTLTDTELEVLYQELLKGGVAFTDAAIAHPRVGNRPKFYSNKHLALFTTFQGFISTFTANILPNIYKGLTARKLGHQVDAARQIALLLALGFLTQALKDQIKYGEDPGWLDDEEQWQRALYASGLLGTTERVVDLAFPLYPQRHDNVVDAVFNTARDEAPAISYARKLGTAGGALVEGDIPRAAKYAVKSAPFVGPLNQLANSAEDTVDDILRGG